AFLKRTVFHSIISTCNQGKEHAVPVRIHSWSTTLRVETNQKQFVLFFFKPRINLFFSIQNKHIQNYHTHINNLPINLFLYRTMLFGGLTRNTILNAIDYIPYLPR